MHVGLQGEKIDTPHTHTHKLSELLPLHVFFFISPICYHCLRCTLRDTLCWFLFQSNTCITFKRIPSLNDIKIVIKFWVTSQDKWLGFSWNAFKRNVLQFGTKDIGHCNIMQWFEHCILEILFILISITSRCHSWSHAIKRLTNDIFPIWQFLFNVVAYSKYTVVL